MTDFEKQAMVDFRESLYVALNYHDCPVKPSGEEVFCEECPVWFYCYPIMNMFCEINEILEKEPAPFKVEKNKFN